MNIFEIPDYLDRASALGVNAVHFCVLDYPDPELSPALSIPLQERRSVASLIKASLDRNADRLEYQNESVLLNELLAA
jgi:hypothetical protein